MADIANAANVSVATVSHVINGTRPVKESTRLRVEAALDAAGYRRDRLARAMRRSTTETVGVVVSDPTQPVFGQMIQGVAKEARAAGYAMMLASSADDGQQELEAIKTFKEHRVDGIILAEVSHDLAGFDEMLRPDSIPLVLLDRLASRRLDQVGAETVGPMKRIVDHLIGNGYDDIAIVAGDLSVPTLQERFEGYRQALDAADIPLRSDRVVDDVRTEREVRAAMRPILQGNERPRALVTSSTNITAGVLGALHDLDMRTPRDVALVSFDELPYAEHFAPRITSVVQPAVQMGEHAMRLLLRRLRNPDAQARTIRLKPRFVHRQSCGCPAGAPSPFGD
ncbi:LacI family DNA-binding transcriptional regulator [Phytohabitans sp. ZYX-F-186]|uniref:LacI family DNA-binding transcriptional regulator n=1 Tax=Phytohabitans maris TaxID=3071409 RepID=A0ABU0ZMM5_9ACTN|nr:LacI family DNA-binding transcriptional regulator [Phytohabitans sp. ZYX-F-186]MDQ7907535.1 LacI family DNA-binding transcriptional regulator [Phytohabitans sp. ZYX-F-186]